MIELLLFLVLGFVLLLVLAFWWKSSGVSVAEEKELSEAQEALDALQLRLLTKPRVERLFAVEDLEFVAREAPVGVRRMFERERKALALSWLRQTRKQAARLMGFHVRVVRRRTKLRAAVDVRLATDYVLLVLVCDALRALIRLRGPFQARQMVGFAVKVGAQMCSLSGQRLAKAHSPYAGRIETYGTNGSTGG